GDARSDLWFTYHLGRKIREKLSAPGVREEETSDILRHLGHTQEEMDQPILDLTWDYPVKGAIAEPDAEAVLAEINGWDARGRRTTRPAPRPCPAPTRSSCRPTARHGCSSRPGWSTGRCRRTTSRRTRRSATCFTLSSATRSARSTCSSIRTTGCSPVATTRD